MNRIKMDPVKDYLCHHGILGQKWGKKNGPPYPLERSARSASEKKKNGDKYTDSADERYGTEELKKTNSQKQSLDPGEIFKYDENIDEGAYSRELNKTMKNAGFKKDGDWYKKNVSVTDSNGEKTELVMKIDGDGYGKKRALTVDSIERMANAVQKNFSEIDKKARKIIAEDNKESEEYGYAQMKIDKNEAVYVDMDRQGLFSMDYGDVTGHSIILEFRAPNQFEFTSSSPYWFG